ncbi:hypothetical protein [Agrobacterium sp. NPDC089420]|uniref:hypothetical protein n=1 Tax=Agrobacterium sp. NPDC089420 TaxID=3363918 RepID=UPI00384D25FD
MTQFSEIPTADFPMNHETYRRLRDEIGSISAYFYNLGTRDGAEVAKKMEEVYGALGDAWETIRRIEDREKRASARTVEQFLIDYIESETAK